MTSRPLPVLHSGDRLTRDEFERRFDRMPGLKRAELIDGTVYVASPVRHDYHGRPVTTLVVWLGMYVEHTPGLDIGGDSSIRLDDENMPQPGALLRIPERASGSSRVDGEGYLAGPPELVVEVAASSVSYDLHQKLDVYRWHGVREYIVHRTEDEAVDWFVLRDGRYVPELPGADGVLRSTQFPGLWLDPVVLLRNDLAALRAVVDRGVQDPAHAPFAARVARALA